MKIAKEKGAVIASTGCWSIRIENDEQAIAAQLAAYRWAKRGDKDGD